MTLAGKLRMTLVLSGWLGGCAAVPVSALLAAFGVTYIPLQVLGAYYSFRVLLPPKKWPTFIEFLNFNKYKYFKSQEIVFDSKKAHFPEANSKTLFALSPHGILGIGWISLITSSEARISCCRWLVADVLSYMPFVAHINGWGDVHGCGKANMVGFMSKGENVGLIPGGFQEASLYIRGRHRVVLKRKTGFIKYALQFGYKVVPVYVFGEEKTMWKIEVFPKRMAMWLNKYNIPATVFYGKYGLLPDDDIDMRVVVGEPLQMPTIVEPTHEDVSKYHAAYVKALCGLFDRHKQKYGVAADVELDIL